jgi:glutamyl-tRNA reductase
MRSEPSFHVVGISHHTAKVRERERFALTPAEISALLNEQYLAGRTGVLLCTCNRCEYYWSDAQDGEAWLRDLARTRGGTADTVLVQHDGIAAVRHLFVVTAGLDSQVLGETEILGQVRRAYDVARGAGTTTPEMDLILSAALSTGRRVRRDTVLGRHPASVSSSAVNLMVDRWGTVGSRPVVVLGAGEAAEGVLRALREQGAGDVTLLSRRPERSRALAQAWGAKAGGLDAMDDVLYRADLLVVATGSARPVVTAGDLAHAASRRGGREIVVIDLGVPRNVEPSARELEPVRLFDLDDLQRLCCPAAGTAAAALEEAQRLIDNEIARLGLTLRGKAAAPRLAELHRMGVEMAEEESDWALAQLESLSENEREVVRQMADRLVRRVLYPVSRTLRSEPT